MPLPGSAPEVVSSRLADPGVGYSLASVEMKGLGDGPVKHFLGGQLHFLIGHPAGL